MPLLSHHENSVLELEKEIENVCGPVWLVGNVHETVNSQKEEKQANKDKNMTFMLEEFCYEITLQSFEKAFYISQLSINILHCNLSL